MITVVLLLGVVIFIIYSYRNYMKQFEDIDKLPGPSTFKLIKEMYFNSSSKGIINYFQSLNSTYGPIVKLWMKPFKPMITTTDMEYCKKVFAAHDFHISPILDEITFMGDGTATTVDYLFNSGVPLRKCKLILSIVHCCAINGSDKGRNKSDDTDSKYQYLY